MKKRIDIILEKLNELTENNFSYEKLKGVTTKDIEDIIPYQRSAISEELNKLVRTGKAIKIKTRPTLFFSKSVLLDKLNLSNIKQKEYDSVLLLQQQIEQEKNFTKDAQNSFSELIGSSGSLKEIIRKLKAAILYPPNGLNIMLTGESGVGKTLITEKLHQFYEQHTQKKIPFVYFNCAEYYNNPELLTSHLFGYKKGSFTGATNDGAGLVAAADGGFLFLDEVHRLTPEGQEKLFTLLDKGYYSRMGEGEIKRDVSIKFIFATTENLNDYFLKTFIRRIPVTLHLPSLQERPLDEKFQLIISFFYAECVNLQKNIFISYQTIKDLIFTHYEANVGEMKAEIQFICAQSYLENMDNNNDYIKIDTIYRDSFTTPEIDTKDLLILNELVPQKGIKLTFAERNHDISRLLNQNPQKRDPFYSYLIKEFTNLKNMNLKSNDALAILQNRMNQLFDMNIFENNIEISEIDSDKSFQDKVKRLIKFIEKESKSTLSQHLKNQLQKHVYSTLFFSQSIDHEFYEYTNSLFFRQITHYDIVQKIVDFVSNEFEINLPETEKIYYDLLLKKIENKSRKNDEECGIIVIAHGASTATSMTDYTNILFSSNIMQAVDMPINQSVDETLDKVKQIIKDNKYKRVILLVDIGSLVYFGNAISHEFNIEVLLISNINILTLLELSREITYESMSFDYLFPTLKEKNYTVTISKAGSFFDSKVLIVSCLTGIGTAIKIEKLLINVFPKEILDSVRIITLENSILQDINQLHSYVHTDEKIIGVIGTVKSELPDIPFISLEDLLSTNGIKLILRLLGYNTELAEHQKLVAQISSRYAQGLSIEVITDMINVLNPKSIAIELTHTYQDIMLQTKTNNDEKKLLRFIIHCACLIERLILNPEYDYTLHDVSYKELPELASVIKLAFRPIEVSYKIQIPPLEIKYIYELLFMN